MFKLKQDVWLKITQGLLKKRGDRAVIDNLMKSGDCPLCSTPSEENYIPFLVDREKLHFHCLACNSSGGPLNFYMLLHRCTAEKAIEGLEKLIK